MTYQCQDMVNGDRTEYIKSCFYVFHKSMSVTGTLEIMPGIRAVCWFHFLNYFSVSELVPHHVLKQ